MSIKKYYMNMKGEDNMQKRKLPILLTIILILSTFILPPTTAYASPMEYNSGHTRHYDVSEGNITITDGTNEGTYKVILGDGEGQIEDDNIDPDDKIILYGTSTENKIDITATEGTLKIWLDGLEINGRMSLSSSENRDVEIVLIDGSDNIIGNSLFNDSPASGGGLLIICEHAGEPGHICDEHCGSLTATGTTSFAGIVGHNTTIGGGNIYATGGVMHRELDIVEDIKLKI